MTDSFDQQSLALLILTGTSRVCDRFTNLIRTADVHNRLAILSDPMIVVHPINPPPPLPVHSLSAHLVVTSPYGVSAAALAPFDKSTPAWAVGPSTAAALRALGLSNVQVGPADAQALAQRICSSCKPGDSVIYFSGEVTSFDLPAILQKNGIRCHKIITYRTTYLQQFSPKTCAIMNKAISHKIPAWLVIFSQKGALAVKQALQAEPLQTLQPALYGAGLSAHVIAPLCDLEFAGLVVAPQPRLSTLASLIASRCLDERA